MSADPDLGRGRDRRQHRRRPGACRPRRAVRGPGCRPCRGDQPRRASRSPGRSASTRCAPGRARPSRSRARSRRSLLCVKAQDTEAAARALAPHLAPDGVVVSAQNGLNERVIAGIVGEARTIGCFVNFGADYHGARAGACTAAAARWWWASSTAAAAHASRRSTGCFAPSMTDAVLTGNIWGYLWSKLIYGALLFATALTDDPIADVLDAKRYRPVLAALGQEVAAVAAAERVRLEPFDGFDPAAFSRGSTHRRARRARSPTWSPSTAGPPRPTAASGAISRCASGAPRSMPRSARSSRSARRMAWRHRSARA